MVVSRVVPSSHDRSNSTPIKKLDFLKTIAASLADACIVPSAAGSIDMVTTDDENVQKPPTSSNALIEQSGSNTADASKDKQNMVKASLESISEDDTEEGCSNEILLDDENVVEDLADDTKQRSSDDEVADAQSLLEFLNSLKGLQRPAANRKANDNDIQLLIEYTCRKANYEQKLEYCAKLGIDVSMQHIDMAGKHSELIERARALVPIVQEYTDASEDSKESKFESIVKITQAMKPLVEISNRITDAQSGELIDTDAPLEEKVRLLMKNYAQELYHDARSRLVASSKAVVNTIDTVKATDRLNILIALNLADDPLLQQLVPTQEELEKVKEEDTIKDATNDTTNESEKKIDDDNVSAAA